MQHDSVIIRPVGAEEIPALSRLATAIVREHFDPLIGKAQNDYMLSRFQTPEAITKQFAEGYRYHWVLEDGQPAGFMAWFPRGDHMYLSKFYVEKNHRGRHLAARMRDALLEAARAEGLPRVELNTNKDNSDVIAIYEHLGFTRLRMEKNDIGNGFYMDDVVMEYRL